MMRGTAWATVLADFGRYAGGGLLVLSAALKYLFPEYSTSESSRLSAVWYSILIAAELALGVAVLFRLFGGVETAVAAVVYATFTGVNVWSVWTERATCGCLGSISVSPKVMLALDAVLTVCLAASLATDGVRPGVRWRWLLALGGLATVLTMAVTLAGGRDSAVAILTGRDIYLVSATVDVGELRSGESVEAPLRLCNRSSQPVRVVGLSNSAAIRPSAQGWSVIAPGTTGDVPVTVTTKRQAGRQVWEAVLFVEVGGRVQEVPFAVVWVVSER
jgi:hypothetical protein